MNAPADVTGIRIETDRMILGFFINNKNVLALELKENGKVIGSLSLDE